MPVLLTSDAQGRNVSIRELWVLLIEDYTLNGRKTALRVNQAFSHLAPFFEGNPISAFGAVWRKYAQHRMGEGAAAGTIYIEGSALRKSLKLAHRAGMIEEVPYIPPVKVKNTRRGFFEPHELDSVLAYLPEHLRDITEFGYFTGWRRGEILGLTWRDVDERRGLLRLEPGCTKNEEGRVFPYLDLPGLVRLIKRRRAKTDQVEADLGIRVRHVFHKRGEPVKHFNAAWNRACERAEIPGRRFHDLRRTAVRRMERAGVPRSVAMKLIGHKTEDIYRRYAIVDEAELRHGVKKLANYGGLDYTFITD